MRPLLANVENLLLLKQVIESGSINKAAGLAHIAQPAMTRRVHKLERQLGLPLLDRTARGILPTIYAKSLLAHIQTVDLELNRAWRNIEGLGAASASDDLALGCTSAALSQLVPATLDSLHRGKQNIHVRVIEDSATTLRAMLRREEVDIIVLGTSIVDEDQDFLHDILYIDPIVVCVRASHPLVAKKTTLSLVELAKTQTWILPDTSSDLSALIKAEFERIGVALPRTAVEISAAPAVLWLLNETNRVGITSSAIVASEVRRGNLRELSGDWQFRPIQVTLYRRKRSSRSPALTRLADGLRSAATRLFTDKR